MNRIKRFLPMVAALALGNALYAQSPVGMVANIPLPDDNAYSTSLRFDPAGNLPMLGTG